MKAALVKTQQTLAQTVVGLPPYGQSKLQSGLTPYIQEGQANPRPPLQPRLPFQHHQLQPNSLLTVHRITWPKPQIQSALQ